MQVRVEAREVNQIAADVLAIPMAASDSRERLPSRLASADRWLGGRLEAVVRRGDFRGKAGEILWLFPEEGAGGPKRALLIGVGDEAKLTADALRDAAGRALGAARTKDAVEVTLLLLTSRRLRTPEAARAAAEGAVLASYRSDTWRTQREGPDADPETFSIAVDSRELRKARGAAATGAIVAEGQNLARHLSNEPPNDLPPAALARASQRLAKEVGLKCRVLDVREMQRRKMGALLAVGQGSKHPPRLVILEYQPPKGRRKLPTVCIVGKGITFDSGGISIKPSPNMQDMKHDMSGAGAVYGLMHVVAKLKLPLHVVGVLAAAENLPDGNAYRPGDILRSMAGKTIEIQNTDAEGRLVLADALHLANTDYKPAAIVDLATLTGACVVALGGWASGLFANHEGLARALRDASEASGERVWSLPVWDEHREHMRSQIADLKNVGGRDAGSSTAAAFLSHFVGETPWAHLDIAGTAWTAKPGPCQPYGATGVGVRLLAELLANWPKSGQI